MSQAPSKKQKSVIVAAIVLIVVAIVPFENYLKVTIPAGEKKYKR